jgi:hypothetical protein
MRWKWVYVRSRSNGLEFAMVSVPNDLTVSQFKSMLGADPRSLVTVHSEFLPLGENDALFERVNNFDTIYIEPQRRWAAR